jgi:hypothetical protein
MRRRVEEGRGEGSKKEEEEFRRRSRRRFELKKFEEAGGGGKLGKEEGSRSRIRMVEEK